LPPNAGLPLRPDNLAPKDPDNKYAEYIEADLYAFLAHYKPLHPVGSAYDYSNPGFGLLGIALARRAGTGYDTLIEQRILKPLGMGDTARTPTSSMRSRMAQGYSYDVASTGLTPAEHWDFGSGVAGAGGYRSTSACKFLQEILGYNATPLAPAFAAMTNAQARRHDARLGHRARLEILDRMAARSHGRTAVSVASAPSSAMTQPRALALSC
jgi:CubicO group peptidase (beta-lactamase class C family)